MSRYLAILIGSSIDIYNDSDEYGGLCDLGVPHQVLGRVCDRQSCVGCEFYKRGFRECKRFFDSTHTPYYVKPQTLV